MDDTTYHHEVDLLLSCTCIVYEQIEAAIFVPSVDEIRYCSKHGKAVTIKKVGYPYRVDDTKEIEVKQKG